MINRYLVASAALAVLTTACAPQPGGNVTTARAPVQAVLVPASPVPAGIAAPQVASSALAAQAATAINPHLAGALMLGSRTIAGNVAAAPNLRSLARAMSSSDAGRAFAATGPVTVFAPSDDAFGRLSPGAMEALLQPANRATLNRLINYHVVRGSMTLADLRDRIARGGGAARLTTVDGTTLVARSEGSAVALTDAQGNKSYIETPDVQQADGVFHVVNGVMIPQLA